MYRIFLITLALLSACTSQNNTIKTEKNNGVNSLINKNYITLSKNNTLLTQLNAGNQKNSYSIMIKNIIGSLITNKATKVLSHHDFAYHYLTLQSAMSYNKKDQTSSWINYDTDISGTITPTNSYGLNGGLCREFLQTIKINDKEIDSVEIACKTKNTNNVWHVIQNDKKQ